ncbi:porin [Lampropedia puyangensis]|nr:porin [Lampropedia puyangensis]
MTYSFTPNRLLALLLSTAALTPAVYAQSNVQIYGLLAPMMDHISVSGARSNAPGKGTDMLTSSVYTGVGNGSTTRMQSSTSHFGFRGTEDLGGGLKTIFQMETGIQLATGELTGGSARYLNRNSRVGLSGKFGTVFAGIWDTPMAWSHIAMTNGVRNPYAGESSVTFVTPGFNLPHSVTMAGRTKGPADAVFNRRLGNTVQYWSPSFSGFSFRFAYGIPESNTYAANGAKIKPTMLGLGTEYATGPFTARYVYQQHKDYFGLAWLGGNVAANPDLAGTLVSGSKDDAHRLILRYKVTPTWTGTLTYDRLSYRTDGVASGSVKAYRRDSITALANYRQGAHSAWGHVGVANKGSCSISGNGQCSTSGLGAQSYGVGYAYFLSRRSDVFVSFTRVRNDSNAQYGAFPRSGAGIAPGSSQNILTVGMEHSF